MADTTVPAGGAVDPPAVTPLSITVVVSATPPTSATGGIETSRLGIDQGGNIWLFFPRTTISGVTAGGMLYAATVTSGGLPLSEP
jgi:hypothetical protein